MGSRNNSILVSQCRSQPGEPKQVHTSPAMQNATQEADTSAHSPAPWHRGWASGTETSAHKACDSEGELKGATGSPHKSLWHRRYNLSPFSYFSFWLTNLAGLVSDCREGFLLISSRADCSLRIHLKMYWYHVGIVLPCALLVSFSPTPCLFSYITMHSVLNVWMVSSVPVFSLSWLGHRPWDACLLSP